MTPAARVLRLMAGDPWRMAVLRTVRALDLPDCWVAAGFVRTCVWDSLHGHTRPTALGDVDVVYFDAADTDPATDKAHDRGLAGLWPAGRPAVPWEVKNQARMHRRHGDAPYADTSDALCHWLETPTAVAVRMDASGALALLAPLGLGDLFAMRLAPTPYALEHRLTDYRARVAGKPWAKQWPRLKIVVPG